MVSFKALVNQTIVSLDFGPEEKDPNPRLKFLHAMELLSSFEPNLARQLTEEATGLFHDLSYLEGNLEPSAGKISITVVPDPELKLYSEGGHAEIEIDLEWFITHVAERRISETDLIGNMFLNELKGHL